MKPGHIALASLITLATMFSLPGAQADVSDGTINRFICITDPVDKGDLQSGFVQLNANDASKGYGLGGGNMVLRLSNNGFQAPTLSLARRNTAGGMASFGPNKKNNRFQIYFKPVNVDISHVRVNACLLDKAAEIQGFDGPLNAFTIKQLTNGWSVLDEDLDLFQFHGARILRLSVRLEAQGDNGHILIGKIQSTTEGVDKGIAPSELILPRVQCGSIPLCVSTPQNN